MVAKKRASKGKWTYLGPKKLSRYKTVGRKTIRQVKDRGKWYTIKYP